METKQMDINREFEEYYKSLVRSRCIRLSFGDPPEYWDTKAKTTYYLGMLSKRYFDIIQGMGPDLHQWIVEHGMPTKFPLVYFKNRENVPHDSTVSWTQDILDLSFHYCSSWYQSEKVFRGPTKFKYQPYSISSEPDVVFITGGSWPYLPSETQPIDPEYTSLNNKINEMKNELNGYRELIDKDKKSLKSNFPTGFNFFKAILNTLMIVLAYLFVVLLVAYFGLFFSKILTIIGFVCALGYGVYTNMKQLSLYQSLNKEIKKAEKLLKERTPIVEQKSEDIRNTEEYKRAELRNHEECLKNIELAQQWQTMWKEQINNSMNMKREYIDRFSY